MKFDNAFLTINGQVGMQFRNKGELVSIYRDAEDKIHTSEGLSEEDVAKLSSRYVHLEKFYKR